jgi:hypothetical protein
MFKAILMVVMMVAVLSIGISRNTMACSLDLSQFQWKQKSFSFSGLQRLSWLTALRPQFLQKNRAG